MNKPTLLIIGYVWPEPNSSAAGTRMLQLIGVFQRAGYQIVYGSPAEASDHAVALHELGAETQDLRLNCSSFDDYIRRLNPQLVMFDRFMMEEQFGWRVDKFCPAALKLLDMEDVHSLRHARHLALKEGKELSAQHIANDMAKREIASILRCDLTLVISEFEMQWLQQQFSIPEHLLIYCPFMLHALSDQVVKNCEDREHFVAIGNFRHHPNWDAVRYLKSDIWPLIRKQLPRAELHIYGAYPPPKATALNNEKQGFLVKGWADSALEVISGARVMLAPLRFGAGLKGKLVDAATTGTPAVTTNIGAEGMYGEIPLGIAIADNAQEFADKAVTLYQSSNDWQTLSANSLRLVEARFNKSVFEPLLLNRINEVLETLSQHRLSNFYGSMLRHHTLRSTEYMAQWIEAKNKLKPH